MKINKEKIEGIHKKAMKYIKQYPLAITIIVCSSVLLFILLIAYNSQYKLDSFNDYFNEKGDREKLEMLINFENQTEKTINSFPYLRKVIIIKKSTDFNAYNSNADRIQLLNKNLYDIKSDKCIVYNIQNLDAKPCEINLKNARQRGIDDYVDFADENYRQNLVSIRNVINSKTNWYLKNLSTNQESVDYISDSVGSDLYYLFQTDLITCYKHYVNDSTDNYMEYVIYTQKDNNQATPYSIDKFSIKGENENRGCFITGINNFFVVDKDIKNNKGILRSFRYHNEDQHYQENGFTDICEIDLIDDKIFTPRPFADINLGNGNTDLYVKKKFFMYKIDNMEHIDTLILKPALTNTLDSFNIFSNCITLNNNDILLNGFIGVNQKSLLCKIIKSTTKAKDTLELYNQLLSEEASQPFLNKNLFLNFKFNQFSALDFNKKSLTTSLADSILLLNVYKKFVEVSRDFSYNSKIIAALGNNRNFLFAIEPVNENGKLKLNIKYLSNNEKFTENEIGIATQWDAISILIFFIVYLIVSALGYILLKNHSDIVEDDLHTYEPQMEGVPSIDYKIKYIESTLSDLKRRSNIMLVIGIFLGWGGAIISTILFKQSEVTLLDDWKKPVTIINVIRPIIMILFVESFAFYFLKQYRIIFNEYKLFYSIYLRLLNYYNFNDVSNIKAMSDESKKTLQSKVIDEKFDLYETSTKSSINEFENYLSMDKFIDLIKDKVGK